jgi:PAS domain S-box-containing protein/putative nucleotidyltransferase with HDIG domain
LVNSVAIPFSSNSLALSEIKGVSYLIVSETGQVFYTSPRSKNLFHILEGDQVQWSNEAAQGPGHLLIGKETAKEKIRVSISTKFDLIWHGTQAKMLILDTKNILSEQQKNTIHKSLQKPQTGSAPWTAFKCKFDETLEVFSIGEQVKSLTGFSCVELTGKTRNYRSLISTTDHALIYQTIQKAVTAHQPYSILYHIQTADGSHKWVEEHGQGIENGSNKIQFIEGWIVDVTDKKKIEDALWESESCYRSLVEASPDVVLMLDKNSNILLGNKLFCDIVGVKDPDLLRGKNIINYLKLNNPIPDNFDSRSFWESLPAKRQIFRLISSDGTVIPMETNLSIIRGNDGEINSCVIVARDNRLRECTQQALRESEARYRAIVENNPEIIVRFDKTGKVTFANSAFLNLFNLTFEQVSGQNLFEISRQKGYHIVRKFLGFVTPDMDPLENEFCFHLSESIEQWYRWRTIAIKDEFGNFLEYQSIGENITDQKKATQAEKVSENRMAQLMENIKLLSIVLNMQGQIISCNTYFTEITGWEKKEILNQDWFSRFIPSDIVNSLKKTLLENALTDQVPTRFENPILLKNGKRRLISWTNTLMKDPKGKPIAIASLGEDITEKNEMQRIQDAIVKISQATNEVNDIDQLFRSIHEILKELVPVDNFYIALYDKSKEIISFPYFVDQFDSPPPPHKPGKGLTEYVLKYKKAVTIDPKKFDELIVSHEVESRGTPSLDWIGIPLKVEKEIIGVMVCQTYSPGIRYDFRHEQILSFVSNQIAQMIDRKKREQALLSSQKRNQLLIEASTDAIFMESFDGSIIDCNEIALRMYGFSREEMLKMNVKDLVDLEAFHSFEDFVQYELDNGGIIRDITNKRKDGSTFPVEVSICQTKTDSSPILVAFIRDITEQKKAAQVIIENEGKFRTLSETTTAGIFIYRGDHYLYVNPMWCQITGFSADELLKMKPLDFMNPAANLDAFVHIEQGNEGEIGRTRVEHTFNDKNGEPCTIDLTVSQIIFEEQPAVIGTAINITNRKQREHELEIIAEMSEALRSNISREQVLSTAMAKLIAILKLDGAFFSLIDKPRQIIEIKKANGVWENHKMIDLKKDQGLSGHIISTNLPYLNNQPKKDPYILSPEKVSSLSSIAGVPLSTKNGTIGAIVIGSKKQFNENDLRLLKAIGDLTAGAIHRADLFEQTIQQTEELRHAYDSTLEGWALALELRDKETQGHSVRITKMTIQLAKRVGIPEGQLENIRRGALLHDIGKLAIPDTILLKNGALKPEEWTIMQKHPAFARDMLSQIKFFQDAIDIPYCHHEWWDGSGYPRGLEGENIPLPARIFCIVDVWDALTTNRPYREAWSKDDALAHIINQAGTHFDPNIVNEFIQMIVQEK